MLKADIHLHTREDPRDDLAHSAAELVEHAATLGFRILSLTNHFKMLDTAPLAGRAAELGILLLPGVELLVEGKHVVVVNATPDAERVLDFPSLLRYRQANPGCFVLAPHPFYPHEAALNERFAANVACFDGVEYCHFYMRGFNPYNRRAVRAARAANLPVIGTSDTHFLPLMGRTYAMVDAEPTPDSVVAALKAGRCQLKTAPISPWDVLRVVLHTLRRPQPGGSGRGRGRPLAAPRGAAGGRR